MLSRKMSSYNGRHNSFDETEKEDLVEIETKPIYGKTTFLWKLHSMETIWTDGVQRAVFYEFQVPSEGKNGHVSKWRLTLDTVDLEPAIKVEKIEPVDESIYFRLGVNAMIAPGEYSDVISFPNTKLFYEGLARNHGGVLPPNEQQTFSLHKQLDYGCSHDVWFKEVLKEGALLLRVNFETCSSVSVLQKKKLSTDGI